MRFKLPNSNETFSYYLPNEKLRQYISYYSVQHNSFSSISPLFIPDLGGSIIISFGLKDLSMIVWGPYNQLTGIESKTEGVLLQFFIEFQPGGLSRFIHPSCQELLNKKISLSEIDNEMYLSLRQIFERNLFVEEEIITSLNRYFIRLLDTQRDFFINGRSILYALQEFKTSGTMTELSKNVNYSTRHINRYLTALTGVSGKEYIKIKRFNEAVKHLKASESSIERIADGLCYYDTAHFIHDFSQLSGVSPMLFRKNKSGFYNESLKVF